MFPNLAMWWTTMRFEQVQNFGIGAADGHLSPSRPFRDEVLDEFVDLFWMRDGEKMSAPGNADVRFRQANRQEWVARAMNLERWYRVALHGIFCSDFFWQAAAVSPIKHHP